MRRIDREHNAEVAAYVKSKAKTASEEELQSLQAETERISAEKLQQISDLEARRAQDSRQMTVLEEEVATLRQDLKAAQAKNAAAAVAEERLRSEAMAAQRQAEESAAEASQGTLVLKQVDVDKERAVAEALEATQLPTVYAARRRAEV